MSGVVGEHRNLLVDDHARDRLRNRLARDHALPVARDRGHAPAVRIDELDRDAIDIENLEHELRDLVEQRVDVDRAREPLRHFEQQRELLLRARCAVESGAIRSGVGEIR
jgi:hypothetical protein